jgi:hypothetical protein
MRDKAKALAAIGVVCLIQFLLIVYSANRLTIRFWMAPILICGLIVNMAIFIYHGQKVKAARERAAGASKIHSS